MAFFLVAPTIQSASKSKYFLLLWHPTYVYSGWSDWIQAQVWKRYDVDGVKTFSERIDLGGTGGESTSGTTGGSSSTTGGSSSTGGGGTSGRPRWQTTAAVTTGPGGGAGSQSAVEREVICTFPLYFRGMTPTCGAHCK